MKNPENFENNQESNFKNKMELWQSKLAELTIPDHYGYVIEEKVRETVAALQLLGINTVQSDDGDTMIYPWIQFHPPYPKNVYLGEKELKDRLLLEHNIEPEEIDDQSPQFDRAKQVEIEETAKDQLMKKGTEYTPEFKDWQKKTLEMTEKLQDMINNFYSTSQSSNGSRVLIDFPYRSSQYRESIYDIPFLQTRSDEEKIENRTEEIRERILSQNRQEMERFTEYLKKQFFLTSVTQ